MEGHDHQLHFFEMASLDSVSADMTSAPLHTVHSSGNATYKLAGNQGLLFHLAKIFFTAVVVLKTVQVQPHNCRQWCSWHSYPGATIFEAYCEAYNPSEDQGVDRKVHAHTCVRQG